MRVRSSRQGIGADFGQVVGLTATLVLMAGTAMAGTFWWDGPAGTHLGTLTDWSAISNATAPDPTALPGTSDTVIFSTDNFNTAATLTLGNDRSFYGMLVRNTGGHTFRSAASGITGYTLSLGAGGLTVANGCKVTFTGSTGNGAINVALGADQVWRNFNADVTDYSLHSLIVGKGDLNADVDLAGKGLTLVGEAGLQLAYQSRTGRIIDSGSGGSIILGANGLLRLYNRWGNVNTNRVADTAAITSYGGKIDALLVNDPVENAGETLGTVTLAAGSLTVACGQAKAAYTSVCALASLMPSGTATALFSGGGLGATGDTRNRLLVGGQPSVALMGGWATVDGTGFASYDTTVFSGYARGVYGNAGSALANNTSDAAGIYNINSASLAATAPLTLGALVINGAGARTLTLGTNTLLLASGGLFFDQDTRDHVITATSGKLTAGNGSDAKLYVTVATATNQPGVKSLRVALADNGGGKITLVKAGLGTLTLATNNTFTGNTVINEGRLSLTNTGAIADSPVIELLYGGTLDVSAQNPAWTLNASQTLRGSGTLSGSATINGALAPGVTGLPSSLGTLTVVGNLTFNNDSLIEVEVGSARLGGDKWEPGYDRLNVAGTVDLGGNAKLDVKVLTGETLASGDRLFIIDNDASDAVTGKLKTLSGTVLNEGDTFKVGDRNFKVYYAADLTTSALTGGNDVALEVVKPSTGTLIKVL